MSAVQYEQVLGVADPDAGFERGRVAASSCRDLTTAQFHPILLFCQINLKISRI
jgi:hypothetical protein